FRRVLFRSFLAVIQRARQLEPLGGDDLVSLLWEEDFVSFQYGYVDLLAQQLPLPQAGGEPIRAVDRRELELEVGAGAAGTEHDGAAGTAATDALATLTRDDFAETLFFLDEAELHQLQQEADLEWHRQVRADVLAALFDRLEDGSAARQEEILGILRQVLPNF